MSTTPDARNRAYRTFVQGLVAAVVIGVATAGLDLLNAGEFSTRTVVIALSSAALTAGLSYVQRAYVDPYRDIKRDLDANGS